MNWKDCALKLSERAFGRRRLWRISRLIYTYCRRDLPEPSAILAEQGVLNRLASSYATGRPWIVLDVGAFQGRWSTALLAHRPESRLFAFEPTPASRETLVKALAGRAEVVPIAVSDRVGFASFIIHGQSEGANLDGVNSLSCDGAGEVVELTTLDAFCAERELRAVDIIKVDAEGYDLPVLRGASELLTRGDVAYVQFEYNHSWLTTRSTLRDVFELVKGTRYAVGKIVLGGVELYDAWHPEMERFFQADYALVRDDLVPLIGLLGHFDVTNTYA